MATKAAMQKYISNPFGLIRPSMRAIRVNLWPVIGVLILAIIGIVAIITALAILLSSTLGGSSQHVGIVIGCAVAALIVLVLLLAIITPIATLILLASAQGRSISWRRACSEFRRYSLRLLGAGALALAVVLAALFIVLWLSYVLRSAAPVLSGIVAIIVVLAGLVIGTLYSLAPYVIVDRDAGIIEGFRQSRRLTRGHLREMWGLYGLDNFLSVIPLLGSFISIILTLLAMTAPAIRYEQLKALPTGEDATTPPVHWANYVVIVLLLVSLVLAIFGSSNSSTQSTPSNYYPTAAPD